MFKSVRVLALVVSGIFAATPLFASSVSAPQKRIVGGSDITIDSAPSTVALLSNRILAETGSYFESQNCGGTVIDAYWVLTAAHCLKTRSGATIPNQDVSVLMGTTNLNAPVNQPVGVTNIVIHPYYNDVTNANDIALLRLEYAALVPATPLDNNSVVDNDVALIAGWGALNAGGNGPQTFATSLKGALVFMISGNDCERLYTAYRGQIDDSNLCAGLNSGGVDACQGDSGGPLYRYDSNNPANLHLSGVVSWGHGCADARAPGVYTRVSAYTDWIQQVSGVTANQFAQTNLPVQSDTQVADTTYNQANTALSQDSRNRSGGGANGIVMLMLLVVIAAARSRSLKQLLPIAVLGTIVSACSVHSAAAQSVDIQALPIGKPFAEVIDSARQLWLQEPSCTVVRTGYGVSRRAYFLETCTFSAQRYNTFCGSHPTWAEYRFLENQLIQVSLELDVLEDEDNHKDCVNSLFERSPELHTQTVISDGRYITTVSDAEALRQTHDF